MKKITHTIVFLGLCLLISVLPVYGQFQTTIGFGYPSSESSAGGVISPTGEFILLGSTFNYVNPLFNPNGDIQFARLNGAGALINPSHILGQPNAESASWIENASCTNGDYIIAGNDDLGSMLLVLVAATGTEVWSRKIGSPGNVNTSACVKEDASLEFILVGTEFDGVTGQSSITATKVSCITPNNLIWSKKYTLAGYSISAASVTTFATNPSAPGDYYVTGKAEPLAGGDEEVVILRIDVNSGSIVFMNRYNIASGTNDAGTCIQGSFLSNPNGELWVSGYTKDLNNFSDDVLMMKTDINGNPIWANNYDVAGGEAFANHFQFAANNKLILTGRAEQNVVFQGTRDGDAMLMQMAMNGSAVDWVRVFDTDDFSSEGRRVEVTAANEYFVTGQSLELLSPSQSAANILAIKTNAQGFVGSDCHHDTTFTIIPRIPVTVQVDLSSITESTLPDFLPTGLDFLSSFDEQTSCELMTSPCVCDFTSTLTGNCFEAQFTATCDNPIPGVYTYEWWFNNATNDCNTSGFPNITTNSPTVNHTFPCGGGVFNVCLKVTDPNGIMCEMSNQVTIPNTCCGQIVSAELLCADTTINNDPLYYFNIVASLPPVPGMVFTDCTYTLVNHNAPATFNIGPIFAQNSSSNQVVIYGFIQVPDPVPLSLSFDLIINCVCPITGLPTTCTLPVSMATVCCKKISVPDQTVCKDAATLDVPILQTLGVINNNDISRVTWYSMPKPPSGICPSGQGTGGTLAQDDVTSALEPLHLYPNTMIGGLCVYAVVELNDGPCTRLTTNWACIQLCEPTNCTINEYYEYCYLGTCIIPPNPFTLSLTPPAGGCPPTWEWFAPGDLVNPVQVGGLVYQPTQCLSMADWLNDCQEDFIYTVRITDECGQRECQATIRLSSDEAPKGTLAMLPFEPQVFCPGEDATLKFTPGCVADPAMWKWFKRSCTTPSVVTPLPGAGLLNGCYNTGKADDTYIYYVETQNGSCPIDTAELKIEVRNMVNITQFDAVSDPCAEISVNLSITFDPCTVSGCQTPCSCTHTVTWFKDTLQIGTTIVPVGGSFASFTYNSGVNISLPGNYYAVVQDDCCPNNSQQSWIAKVFPSCEPWIKGPCFMCDDVPVTLMAHMVLPPTDPCPYFCTYSWTGPGVPPGTNTQSITTNLAGIYTVVTSCFTNGGNCVKSAQFEVTACYSALCPPIQHLCCADSTAFFNIIESEVTVALDDTGCTAVFDMGILPACDYISYINWGDGSESIGPFGTGDAPSHTYLMDNTYTITYEAIEENEDTGEACFYRTYEHPIAPICSNNCACGPFTGMTFGPVAGGGTMHISCGADIPIACQPGTNYVLSGAFSCLPVNCNNISPLTWILYDPNGDVIDSDQGTVTTAPNFSVTLPSGYFYYGGTYTMELTGHCMGTDCPCTIYFVVDPPCPALCPCDIAQFQADVAKGFLQYAYVNNSCKRCFKPKGLTACDSVYWEIPGTIPPISGSTYGNQTFCVNFPPPGGTYTVSMTVTRKKDVNSICEVFNYQKTIYVNCSIQPPICANPRVFNPGFDSLAVAGVLGMGGESAKWIQVVGSPEVGLALVQDMDEWVMTLAGNESSFDAFRTLDPICLEKDTGTISIRLRSVDLAGNAVLPKAGEKLIVQFVRNDNFLPATCGAPDCYEVAVLEIPESLDDWADVEVFYDLSNEAIEDLCSETPSLMVHPVIYISNDYSEADSTSRMQIDYFCLSGPGFIVGTSLLADDAGIHLFPNPTNGQLTLEFKGEIPQTGSLIVRDIFGRIVRKEALPTGASRHDFSLSNLPAGVYLVQVLDNGVFVWAEKVVKE